MTCRIFLLIGFFLLCAPPSVSAEPIGRLFFSPDERATLDRMRQKNGGVATSSAQVTLNGLVRRSRGKTTAWVNQIPQPEHGNTSGITVLKSTARSPVVPLQLPSGKQVHLKPGQTFDTTKGKIREGYENAANPSPAEVLK